MFCLYCIDSWRLRIILPPMEVKHVTRMYFYTSLFTLCNIWKSKMITPIVIILLKYINCWDILTFIGGEESIHTVHCHTVCAHVSGRVVQHWERTFFQVGTQSRGKGGVTAVVVLGALVWILEPYVGVVQTICFYDICK